MERKYYDYANNHDGFDIYQDFDYHGDERKQTRTRRRKWEKVRRRGKVKSILNYLITLEKHLVTQYLSSFNRC